jgi:hypothetical protein
MDVNEKDQIDKLAIELLAVTYSWTIEAAEEEWNYGVGEIRQSRHDRFRRLAKHILANYERKKVHIK